MRNQAELKLIYINGLAGSGKDTQAGIIAEHLPLTSKIISTGTIVREAMESEKNQYHQILKDNFEQSRNGGLVDDMPILNIVIKEIDEGIGAGKDTQIFPGFERTKFQHDFMNSHYAVYEQMGMLVRPVYFLLDIPESKSKNRAEERRNKAIANGETIRRDDYPDVVERRVKEFNEKIRPFSDYLDKEKKLIIIDGRDGIGVVARKVLTSLNIVPNEEIIQRAIDKAK